MNITVSGASIRDGRILLDDSAKFLFHPIFKKKVLYFVSSLPHAWAFFSIIKLTKCLDMFTVDDTSTCEYYLNAIFQSASKCVIDDVHKFPKFKTAEKKD